MKKHRLKLFNSESREKEEISASKDNLLRMYTCGPTVYNFAHIGNFRTYVFEDLLRRTLKFFGFDVVQAMNLTDIDDKTIKGAIQNHVTLEEFTKPYKFAFFEDLKTLNIEPVEYYPEATRFISEMIEMIEKLLEKGSAYIASDGSVYFSILKFPSYGRLSHLPLDELKIGASEGISADEYEKENASDFVLWKAYDPERDGQVYWESPFGKGRPGWHLECSVMAMQLLGPSIDIHVGGIDNLFPHHENEIAQSEAYSCCRFVRYWLHSEHLLVDHKKMSKSLGNFFTLRDLLNKGYNGKEVRYMLLQTHYRTQLNFTFAGLDAARATLERLSDFVLRLQAIRHEKMHKALDLILEKALPENPLKKQIRERILVDIQTQKERNILDPALLEPVLERSLGHGTEKAKMVTKILNDVKEERGRILFNSIIQRCLHTESIAQTVLNRIIADVRDEKETDILDPDFMKPILQKALHSVPEQGQVVSMILHDLKVKKDHGFILPVLEKTMHAFINALGDDLNISGALAALFEMIREVNTLCDQDKIGIAEAEDVLDFLTKIDQVLGVIPLEKQEKQIPVELLDALERRERARTEKEWRVADECRDFIQSQGYLIEDTPQGARLKKR